MPGRDGSGPVGAGPMTGRGLGICRGVNKSVKYGSGRGLGLACRRSFGRGFGRGYILNEASSKKRKELLQEQKAILQSRLEVIKKQLDNL